MESHDLESHELAWYVGEPGPGIGFRSVTAAALPGSVSDNTASRVLRVAVFGAGAVGGVFGARLAQAGHEVWFVARGKTREALESRGLRLDSVDGNVLVTPVNVTADTEQIGAVDVVLVAVKATQVSGVAAQIAPLIAESTAVIPLQNGVEASSRLADELGNDHVLEGLCHVIAAQVEPGHISHRALVPTIIFGVRPSFPPTGAVEAMIPVFAAALQQAGIKARTPDDMGVALWEKFLFIEPIGSVLAASGRPFGVVRSVPETRALIDQALGEAMAVGRAAGVALPDDVRTRTWALYDGMPAEDYTSMARDLIAGRPSEFDAQTGSVLRMARRHGVAVPVHDVLHAVLLARAVEAI